MAYPENLTIVTVAGKLVGHPSSPALGIRLIAPTALRGPGPNQVVVPIRTGVVVPDPTGSVSFGVPATDDPAYTPAGWSYLAEILYGTHTLRGRLVVPYNTVGTLDLADALVFDQPADSGVTQYLTQADVGVVGGVPGPLDVNGKISAAQLPAASGGAPAWSEITGKPVTFPPAAHTHPTTDVVGLEARLAALEAGGGTSKPTFAGEVLMASGSSNFPSVNENSWTAVPGLSMPIAAVAGDRVTLTVGCLIDRASNGVNYYELVILSGGLPVRYASTGTSSPAGGNEGDPAMYPQSPGQQFSSIPAVTFSLTVAPGDLSGGNVTFGMAHRGLGEGKIYASTVFPFRWHARNDHQ